MAEVNPMAYDVSTESTPEVWELSYSETKDFYTL